MIPVRAPRLSAETPTSQLHSQHGEILHCSGGRIFHTNIRRYSVIFVSRSLVRWSSAYPNVMRIHKLSCTRRQIRDIAALAPSFMNNLIRNVSSLA